MSRHQDLNWGDIESKLKSSPEKLWSLNEMETSGGEPDVFGISKETSEYIFYDSSMQNPKGRRKTCYDLDGLNSRKAHKPEHSAVEMAAEMGIDLMSEEEYKHLQSFGKCDTKSSSWLNTPPSIRALGGALFGDVRFDHIFIYHNGAQSYYSDRGFRGVLKV